VRFDRRRRDTRLALEHLIQATCPVPPDKAHLVPRQG
jgi:hypothetical protein